MDWNKTKTIFIVVFSILNVFLYSLYVTRVTETQNVQAQGKISIEDSLRLDNIRYGELPDYNEDSFYVSAEVATFTTGEVSHLKNQVISIVDSTQLISTMEEPVSIRNLKGDYTFDVFLEEYVFNGKEYGIWKVDEENQEALFFQTVNKNPIYYNHNAMLTIRWNDRFEVTNYEQRMFGEFVKYNWKKDLLPPLQAINTLNLRNYVKPDSKIISMSLGYSTLVPLTKRQAFAPTWHIRVELSDGEKEDYFVNAIEGLIIEFQDEPIELDDE
ncbi:two-component system regulatory protein YycI [Sporosarcina sp. CAU 1771]